MQNDKNRLEQITMNNSKILHALYERSVIVTAIVVVALAAIILFFKVLTHFPFFDETVHVRYLWQFSNGLRPGTDFFCVYPALGYLLVMPLMGMFPESAFVFLALRSISLILVVLIGSIYYYHGSRTSRDWIIGLIPFLLIVKSPAMGAYFSEFSIDHMAALAAVAAIAVYFTKPRLGSIAGAAALASLSVMITPKYPLPLIFGMAGYLAAWYGEQRRVWTAIAAVAAGAAAALTLTVLLFLVTGTSLTNNFEHSFLMQYRWHTVNARFGFQAEYFRPVALAIYEFLIRNWVAGVAIILGIAGWANRSWKKYDTQTLAGAGVLLGTLISSFLIKDIVSQYVAPRVLCMAFFTPFAYSLSRHPAFVRILRLAMVVGALITVSGRIDDVAQRFEETPFNARGMTRTLKRAVGKVTMAPNGILMLADYDLLLEIIPRDERVVATWPFHPLFRRDQTIITFDERPSYYYALPPGDPLRYAFDPASFRMSLEQHPPAMIYLDRLEYNYPPGWKEVAQQYLSTHKGEYIYVHGRFDRYPVRRDLVVKTVSSFAEHAGSSLPAGAEDDTHDDAGRGTDHSKRISEHSVQS